MCQYFWQSLNYSGWLGLMSTQLQLEFLSRGLHTFKHKAILNLIEEVWDTAACSIAFFLKKFVKNPLCCFGKKKKFGTELIIPIMENSAKGHVGGKGGDK